MTISALLQYGVFPQAFAILSQLCNIDTRRIIEKKGHVDADLLAHLKKAASLLNFG